MQRRINGLRAECALLDTEIANHEAGGQREIDQGPNQTKVDITDIFVAHLRDLLGAKLRFVVILEARLATGV